MEKLKIDISKITLTPKGIPEECCVFKVTPEIVNWIDYNNLNYTVHPKGYYNINLPEDVTTWSDLFRLTPTTKYLDGFSPNLNKELHLGHLANLVYASALSSLEGYNTIAILNDTHNDPNKDIYIKKFKQCCNIFNYNLNAIVYASEMKVPTDSRVYLSDNEDYKGCKVIDFPVSGTKVLERPDGRTTYIGQDLGLLEDIVKGDCTYLTGAEQVSHFQMLHELYPGIVHIPQRLITLGNEKMSSRKGNVIYLKDVIREFPINHIKDSLLTYNIKTFKSNLVIKEGLSKFLKEDDLGYFEDRKLNLVHLIAKSTLNPSFLYNYLKKSSSNDISHGLKLLGYEVELNSKQIN